MKTTIYAVAITVMMAGVTQAAIIYEATTGNTTLFNNNNNATGSMTLTGATPDLLLANSHGNFNTGGFASTDSINTLNGTALTASDTVTMIVTVDSISHTDSSQLRSRGFEFGMASTATFDGNTPVSTSNLILNVGGVGNPQPAVFMRNSFADFTVPAEFAISEASAADGFSVTLTANAAGFTFSFSGLEPVDPLDTVGDVSGTFTGTQFVDFFGAGRYYASAQKRFAGTTTLDFSVATIDVTTIPEPSSLLLLGGMGAATVLGRRRQRS